VGETTIFMGGKNTAFSQPEKWKWKDDRGIQKKGQDDSSEELIQEPQSIFLGGAELGGSEKRPGLGRRTQDIGNKVIFC